MAESSSRPDGAAYDSDADYQKPKDGKFPTLISRIPISLEGFQAGRKEDGRPYPLWRNNE